MSVNFPRFSLYERSNNIYYIGYYANGRRRWKSTSASTKSDALKALTELRELLAEPRRVLTFRQFVADFLAYSATVHAGKTVALFRTSLHGFKDGICSPCVVRSKNGLRVSSYVFMARSSEHQDL